MSVKVAVRVRPFNQREKFLGCLNCIQMKDKTTILINPRDRNQKQHQFTFDYSFWSHDGFEQLENGYLYPIDDRFIDQKRIFKELGEEIITSAWNGFNCCLFAYGQTGAGKSYSMIGYESNRGIVPMACEKIFQGIEKTRIKGKKQFEVTISMLEIYNQKVQDLFMHTSKRPPNGLKIRENKKFGIYVEGLTKFEVKSYREIQKKMEDGAKHRSLAATLMNQYSSRAHTIVIIEFIQKQWITEQKMNQKSSTLNLVDLAGSERIAKTGINDKDRLKEASQINKSLHTLGRVIEHLAEQAAGKGKTISIPYRESALTRILETALGGNSMTTMICAISPANDNYEQTLSTLRYADQAKKIKNKPIINESAVDKIIRELREQNERLKDMLRLAKLKGLKIDEDAGTIQANIMEIQQQIRKTMKSFAINTDNDDGQDVSNLMMTEFIELPDPSEFNPYEIQSVSDFDSSMTSKTLNVYLTNLSEDPMLSFKIKYSCESQLYIGNKNLKEGGQNKLILCGLGIQDRHARIFQMNDKYYIDSLNEHAAEYTLVNGQQTYKSYQLYHNDRIILGTNSAFLFKNLLNRQMRKSNLRIITKTQNKYQQGTGIGTGQDSTRKYKSEPINVRSSIGNQSLLLEDLDEFDIVPKKYEQIDIAALNDPNIQTIEQREIDYEFAINERQTKLENSTSFTSSNNQTQGNNQEMQKKIEEIEKEFQLLMEQNQRKMRQKEQKFREEMKKVEMERQAEKKKLTQELRDKESEALEISKQKNRLEKLKDRLLNLQRQKKQREEQEERLKQQLQKKQKQVKVQYIDRDHHHFHYQYNQMAHQIQQPHNVQPNPQENNLKENTTSTTFMGENQDQSLLLDSPGKQPIYDTGNIAPVIQIEKQQEIEEVQVNANVDNTEQVCNQEKSLISEIIENRFKKNDEGKKRQVVLDTAELPHQQIRPNATRKISLNQLNITDIIETPPEKIATEYVEDQSNLLNITEIEELESYIPNQDPDDQIERPLSLKLKKSSKQYNQISLNISDDSLGQELGLGSNIREGELTDKIKQLEDKLRQLQEKQTQKKQNIKNIRQSFIQGFGESPCSQNFFIDNVDLEEDLDLSAIPSRKDSSEHFEGLQFQRKLKLSMVQCQNQNILNQRSLQVRKRKREADELRQMYIKKQKRQIQKQLITLIPMLQKFNLMAREMSRNIQGKIEIEYRNFTNYEILEALKSHTFKSKINIQIKIINYEEGRVYHWPTPVFENRFEILENVFQKYLENSAADYFLDKFKDPFWEPKDFQPYAVSYLSLQCLCYALSYEGEVSFVHKGNVVAKMEVSVEPIDNHWKFQQQMKEQVVVGEIQDPRQILQKDLYFTLNIDKITPTEHLQTYKIEKFYISYEIIEDGYRSRTYKTQEFSIKKTDIMYSLRHSFRNITEHTLAYLADSPICFNLNLLLEFDDELSNMTSSFIHSQSNLNLSSSLNSSDESQLKHDTQSVVSVSPSTFKKKSNAVVFENTEVLGKIEKQYSSYEKKKQKKSENSSPSSSHKKRTKHNQKQCKIF